MLNSLLKINRKQSLLGIVCLLGISISCSSLDEFEKSEVLKKSEAQTAEFSSEGDELDVADVEREEQDTGISIPLTSLAKLDIGEEFPESSPPDSEMPQSSCPPNVMPHGLEIPPGSGQTAGHAQPSNPELTGRKITIDDPEYVESHHVEVGGEEVLPPIQVEPPHWGCEFPNQTKYAYQLEFILYNGQTKQVQVLGPTSLKKLSQERVKFLSLNEGASSISAKLFRTRQLITKPCVPDQPCPAAGFSFGKTLIYDGSSKFEVDKGKVKSVQIVLKRVAHHQTGVIASVKIAD